MLLLLLACTDPKGAESAPVLESALPWETAIEAVPGSGEADPVYDDATLHEIEITLPDEDWDTLRHQSRDLVTMLTGDCLAAPWDSPYTWFEAELRFDGEDLGPVGLRKKALLGSDSAERPSLRVDMDYLVEGGRFRGLEKLVFNNNNQDWSRVRTCLAHGFYADAGLVAPRCSLARVTVNGEDLGIYDNTEAIDEDLVERVLGEAPRTMYEGRLSDFREGWLGTFEAKNDESTGEDLLAVQEALEASDEDLAEALDVALDLDAFYTFWAAEAISGHWDSYNGNTNNFYVYGHPDDGRLHFIASGPDAAFDSREPFGEGQPTWVITASVLANRLIQIPETRAAYEARVQLLLDEAWREDERLAQLDAYKELLSGEVSRDERRALSSLREVVAAKQGDVEDQLGGEVEPGALSEDPCLSEIGVVDVIFRTEFGSYPDGDLFSGGSVDAFYQIGDTVYPTVEDGVSAGWYDDASVLWLTISEVADETWIAPYVVLDAEAVTDGAEIVLGEDTLVGYLLYNAPDTGGEWTVAAYLGLGSIQLEEGGLDDGDTWSGTLQATVLGGD